MEPMIIDSARKRGFADDEILHAYENALGILHDDEGFTMRIGGDTAGRLLEIGSVLGHDGSRSSCTRWRPESST